VSKIDCDALLLDNLSVSDTVPQINVMNPDSIVGHEASA
jgi:Fe-S cluster assembly scaffold protein SufB